MPRLHSPLTPGVRLPVVAMFLACLGMALLAASAGAQTAGQYKSLPYKELDARARSHVLKVLAGRIELEENKRALDVYFKNYIFAEWTLPENVDTIAKERQSFFNRYMRAARDQTEVYKYITQLTFDVMKQLVAGKDYHPAVRYNAMLVLGELDIEPAIELGADKRPPVPLPEALPILVIATKSPQLPDPVRVAAMIGLERHVRFSYTRFTEPQRDEITRQMLEIVTQQQAPAGRTQSGHDWFRRLAIEILALMGQTGGNNEVVDALENVIGERRSPMWLRCTAAQALGQLNYDARDTRLKVGDMTTNLAQLALDICTVERSLANRNSTASLANPVNSSRRRLAGRLTSVATGLKAPAQIASSDNKPAVDNLVRQVEGILDTLKSKEIAQDELALTLVKSCQALETQVGAGPKPTKASDPATDTPADADEPQTTDDPFAS